MDQGDQQKRADLNRPHGKRRVSDLSSAQPPQAQQQPTNAAPETGSGSREPARAWSLAKGLVPGMFLVALGVSMLAYAGQLSHGYLVGTPTTATVRSLRMGRVTPAVVLGRHELVLQRNVERRRTVTKRTNQAIVLGWRWQPLQRTRLVDRCPRE